MTAKAEGACGRKGPFRAIAVERYLRGDLATRGEVLRAVSPGAMAAFWLAAAALAAAVAGACFGRVELTSRGVGVLRAGGMRPLQAEVPGVVAEVFVRSGDDVAAGAQVLRLESAAVEASLLEAEKNLALFGSSFAEYRKAQASLFAQRERALRRNLSLLREGVESQGRTIARLDEKAVTYEALRAEGLVEGLAKAEVQEQGDQARRQRLALEEGAARAEFDLATIEAEQQSLVRKWEEQVNEARTRRDALAFSLRQTRVVAPEGGRVEAVLVKPGDVVQAGVPVGKLVAAGPPAEVVAFLSERDRAFVEPGTVVRVEVSQLPYGEFGALRARVVRVAGDLASAPEVREALGEGAKVPGPSYRVELELVDDERAARLRHRLRTGMLADVRFTLRRRRLLGIVFEPLGRLFE